MRLKYIEGLSDDQLEHELFENINTLLNNLLVQVRPKDTFVLAIDGVAPMAKIKQQRSRRFLRVLDPKARFDSNAITPGTDFMFRLDEYLRQWLDRNKLNLPPTVIYSSHMVPGEGEHKIMDLIRNNQIEGTKSHVLYGLDADLVMLSLMAPIAHVLLMREDINEVVNIDNFRNSVETLMTGKPPEHRPQIWHDYVVIMSLLGNDFLPHPPSLEDFSKSIDTLVGIYRELGISLTSPTRELILSNIVKYLIKLAEREPGLLKHEASRNYKFPSSIMERSRESDGFNIEKFRDEWYFNTLTPRGLDEELIKKLAPELFTVSSRQIQEMSKQYLRAIFWVYRYYSQGIASINLEWFYNYFHSPLFTDVAQLKLDNVDGYEYEGEQRLMTPIHQLLSVLPLSSQKLVPSGYRHLMDVESPLADLYPIDFPRELEGKNAEWQAIPIIPMVNASRIFKAVGSTQLTETQSKEYRNKYKQANNVKIIKPLEYRKQEKAFRTYKNLLRSHGHQATKEPRSVSETVLKIDLSEFRGPLVIKRENWLTKTPLI